MKSKKSRSGIACGGSWIIDRTKVIDHYPTENSLAMIRNETRGGGGCAYNVLMNLAKFDPDLPLEAVGLIGTDQDGDYIFTDCARFANVNTQHLHRTEKSGTSYTDVYSIQGTASRIFFHYLGANRLFNPEEVAIDQLVSCFFHLGYLLLLERMDCPDDRFGRVSARFLHDLQQQHIKTSIDLVSADTPDFADVVIPALPYTDYCIINDFEAEKLTAIPIRKNNKIIQDNLSKISKRIFSYGVGELVVIHFPEGAYLGNRKGKELIFPSVNIPDNFIVGATGAGDSFCAGILYGLYQQWSEEQALRFALCAGACNLQDVTTTGAITHWRTIAGLADKYGFREGL
jgi:sugar/nucleoside kinase (ribokinase family)